MHIESKGMFSENDMETLRKAIASMAISAPEHIESTHSEAHSEYLEGDLSETFGRLTEIIREDSNRPDVTRVLAQSGLSGHP